MSDISDALKQYKPRNFYSIRDSGIVYLWAILLPLVVGIVFGYISMFIASNFGMEFAEGSNIIADLFANYLWFSIPYALLTQIVFVCLYFVFHKVNKISYKATTISFKKANIWTAFLSVLVGIICVLGFIWLIEGCFGAMFDRMGIETSSLGLPLSNVGWLFLNLLILGVVPAICEEFIFRGIVFKGLREKFSGTASVLLCGLMFALIHQSITQFIYPFILGCLLSFVMEKTNNLLYPILIHMFNNFTTIIISFLQETGVITLSFNVAWWGVICAILIAVATCALLWVIYRFYLKKQQKLEEERSGQVTQAPPIMVGKLPLTIVCGIICTVILIVINLL